MPTNPADPWANLSTYACSTCRFFVPKDPGNGRCRHAPTMDGYPVVYTEDWCGDHKLGTNPSRATPKTNPAQDPEFTRLVAQASKEH